ncbi:hypothetical protein [Furfurilactobacillus siliginis]|uniref:Uncharacterized protein n=1 Tax=Furfurilactobacillus siliginis TaxID=348151 RepID=A0A0R2L9E5_9LACO|nr:hypothetical protein [Furfurilactobacillus siliginis]KRN95373.1 hypothetical protein IV55_GL002016 [Furfurilactobacillus siliginis]GEK28152.1 hypothetical protein LSI01_04630 [Furfurilactobacillus siliginis]
MTIKNSEEMQIMNELWQKYDNNSLLFEKTASLEEKNRMLRAAALAARRDQIAMLGHNLESEAARVRMTKQLEEAKKEYGI